MIFSPARSRRRPLRRVGLGLRDVLPLVEHGRFTSTSGSAVGRARRCSSSPCWRSSSSGRAELLERDFGRGEPWSGTRCVRGASGSSPAPAALLAAGLVVVLRGQPTAAERWSCDVRREARGRRAACSSTRRRWWRSARTSPSQTVILDVRDEHDFNVFHVGGARRLSPEALLRAEEYERLVAQPASTVTFLVGNGEGTALETWKGLKALGVPNLYVVEGGINRWLELYPVPECVAARGAVPGPNRTRSRFGSPTRRARASRPRGRARHLEGVPHALRGGADERGAEAHAEVVWPSYCVHEAREAADEGRGEGRLRVRG